MGLRNRILLLVALGLLIATAPLGLMGLGMVRAATNRILEERLAMAQASAASLSEQLAQGWRQLDRVSARAAAAFRRGDFAVLRRDFADLAPHVSLFSGGVFLLDASGRVVAREPFTLFPPVLAQISSVQNTLRLSQPQIGLIIRGQDQRSLAIFSVPVLPTPTRASGAVVGLIDLNKPTLRTFIDGLAMGTSGHATIVDRDGTVLASTNSATLFTQKEHPEFFRSLIESGRARVGHAEGAGADGRPETHVTAFAPISAAPWGVGIGQSEDEALGAISRLRDRIVVFETFVLLAALIFAWVDTTSVVRPLRILRRAAERIAEGDLAQQVEVRRADEIGVLARTFEAMRLRLLRSLDENARLQERLQSVAMLEERERIAREMHDNVGQVLGYVNTKAQAVRALLEAGKVREAEGQMEQLEQAARAVYADLREAILNLRATTSTGRGLLPALEEYVRRFTELSGVHTALVVDDDRTRLAFSPTAEAHLIRIIQEALTNVRKHAMARTAVVRFTIRGDTAVVTVEDDGIGIQAGGGVQPPASGFGLQTMRERAEAIGGATTVLPRPGGGTRVQIELPAPPAGEIDARLAG